MVRAPVIFAPYEIPVISPWQALFYSIGDLCTLP